MDQADLYDYEVKEIGALVWQLHRKYGTLWTETKLEEFKKEAEQRFFDLGFKVSVSTAPPMLGLGGPSIEVIDRVKPIEFDHEKKAWEVVKDYKDKGKL